MNLARELELACDLAREGGALALTYLRAGAADAGDGPDLGVQMKSGEEPVTLADQAINELCVQRLRTAFPGDALLTEELPDDGSRHGAMRTWLVDPIDGTKDFIAGRPGFAVMIGLLRDGQPVLGVVYQPIDHRPGHHGDALYFAVKGQGAYRASAGGPAERLRVSEVQDLSQTRMVSSASHPSPEAGELRRQAGITDELHIGSIGIKLSLIAAGERDLYFNTMGRTKLWDTCAPHVVLAEAGGVLTDLLGGPIDYRSQELSHRRGLLASNGPLHQAALARIHTIFKPS